MLVYLVLAFCLVSLNNAIDRSQPCPRSWTFYDPGNTCIKVFTLKMTWEHARLACQQEGGDLVQIRNSDTNTVVKDMLTRKKRYWIGATDTDENGRFEYVDGEDLFYHPWASKEPNNKGGNERCVEIIGNQRGSWNDKRCSMRRPFICEIKLDQYGDGGTSNVRSRETVPTEKGAIYIKGLPETTPSYIYIKGTREIYRPSEQTPPQETGRSNGTIFTLTTNFEVDDLEEHYTYSNYQWRRYVNARYPERGYILGHAWQQPGVNPGTLTSLPFNVSEPSCLVFDYLASTDEVFVFGMLHQSTRAFNKIVTPTEAGTWQRGHLDINPTPFQDVIEFQVGSQESGGFFDFDNFVGLVGSCRSHGF